MHLSGHPFFDLIQGVHLILYLIQLLPQLLLPKRVGFWEEGAEEAACL